MLSDLYISTLLITVVIELVIALGILGIKLKQGVSSIAINLVTHPWAFILYKYLNVQVILVELLVFVAEILLWRFIASKSWKMCVVLSLLTNVGSAFLGGFLHRLVG